MSICVEDNQLKLTFDKKSPNNDFYMAKEIFEKDLTFLNKVLTLSCQSGHLDIFQFLSDFFKDKLTQEDFIMHFYTACKSGQLEMLKFLKTRVFGREKNFFKFRGVFRLAFGYAAEYNQPAIMEQLYEWHKRTDLYVYSFKDEIDIACCNGFIQILRYVIDNAFVNELDMNRYITLAAKYNQLEILKELKSIVEKFGLTIDFTKNYQYIFRKACLSNNEEILDYLYDWIHEKNQKIDFSVFEYSMYRKAQKRNDKHTMKFINSHVSNIDGEIENIQNFKKACLNNELDEVSMMLTCNPELLNIYKGKNRKLLTQEMNDMLRSINIYKNLHFIGETSFDEEECPICKDCKPELFTKCGHYYCEKCIVDWFSNGKMTCPMCREEL